MVVPAPPVAVTPVPTKFIVSAAVDKLEPSPCIVNAVPAVPALNLPCAEFLI